MIIGYAWIEYYRLGLMLIKLIKEKKCIEAESAVLIDIWERSVRATHTFLTDDDIISIKPDVISALTNIEKLLFLVTELGKIVGFMGIDSDKLEMLFIAPEYVGKGFGKMMLLSAIHDCGAVFVDVNEDNINALNFYIHMGFKVFARSETDGQGRHFPILHMKFE